MSFRWLTAMSMFAVSGLALAQAHFLPATDARLRADLALLVDEGVLALPSNAWPIPAADVSDAVARVKVEELAEGALQMAVLRVRARVMPSADQEDWQLREVRLTAGDSGLLRSYGAPARDNFELGSTGSMSNDRGSLSLSVTAVGSPEDGHELRLDGSALTVRWGNWLFSANQMDRWWGPGWDGSLILSNNARPMPALSVDRLRSTPVDFPILRWLGPWRFTAFLARMDKYRRDVDEPLSMGMRLSFRPLSIVEFGLSRTAQFCGKGRPCDASTFWNVLAGNDNAGLRVAAEDEPGNQMAGLDVRVVSPFRRIPVALYGQFIGEDNSSSGIPERYLGLLGLDSWAFMDSGASLRWHVEYANTNCKFTKPSSELVSFANCAYRQGIFKAGYRFKARNIGHTADADSEAVSLGAEFTRVDGTRYGFLLRHSLLDRYAGADVDNPLTAGPGKVRSAELSWSQRVFGQDVSLTGGYEKREQGVRDRGSQFIGFFQIRHAF